MHRKNYQQPMPGEQQRLLTVGEVCRQLSCSRSFFYSERAAGRLACKKMGNATRVTQSELDRYVTSLCSAPIKEGC